MKRRRTRAPVRAPRNPRPRGASTAAFLGPLLAVSLAFLLAPLGYAWFGRSGVYMETWPDGSIKVRAVSKRTADGDYIFDGPYVAYYPDGRKEREGEMRNGKEEGRWTWWTESGRKLAEGDFQAGSGSYTSFHPDGRVDWSGRFEDGERSGNWTQWDEQGRKVREGPYVDGEPHGEWTYWHEDDPARMVTVRWEHGVMVEEDSTGTTRSPRETTGPPDAAEGEGISFVAHLLQVLLLVLILAGPIPLTLSIVAASPPEREDLATAHAWLVFIVVWIGLQIMAGLVLGALRQLHLTGVLLLEIGLLAAGLAGWRGRRPPWSPWLGSPGSTRPTESSLMLALVVTGLASTWWLLAVPTDNFDSLAYHLPTMIRWTQEQAFVRMPELGQVAFYPFHWEVLGTLFLLPFGEDLAGALPNLLSWVLAGLSVYLLARRLDVSKPAAKLAAALLLSLPILLSRLSAIQPDLALGAFFLATLYLAGAFARPEHRPPLLALALAVAVLLGLKTSALVYAAAALAVVTLERARTARGGHARLSSLLPSGSRLEVAAALGLVVAVGGFWYLRNWIDTGNPLGFVRVQVGGVELLAGSVGMEELRRGSLARLFEPGRSEHWRILGQVVREHLGLPFAVIVLGLLGFPLRGRRSGVPTAAQSALVLALVLLTFILYWSSPYSADNGAENWRFTPRVSAGLRFGFPFFMVLTLAGAVGLSTARRWVGIMAVLAVLACALGVTLMVQPPWIALAIIVAAALGGAWLANTRPSGLVAAARPSIAAALLAAALLLFGATSYLARGVRDGWRSTFYGRVYDYVEARLGPEDTLGYALTQTRSPFYGKHLDRRLISVVPRSSSREEWLARIEAEGIDYLLVGTTTSNEEGQVDEANVRRWVEAQDAPFERLLDYQSRRRDLSLYRRLEGNAPAVPP